MMKLFRVYSRMMKVHWAILLEYRGDTLFYMLGSFVYPLVLLAVWWAVAAGGSVGGYDQQDFVLYFLMVMFVARMGAYWDPWAIEPMIREGTLSSYLLRPSAFFHWQFSENLVYKLFYGVVMIAAWMIAWPFTEAVRIPLHPSFLAVAVSSLLLAILIRYMMGFCLALLGFWTTRVLAITNLFELMGQFLSGRIAPFALLPDWVQTSQNFMPFYWTLGFPVDVLTEKVTGAAIWNGLLIQAVWMAVFVGLYFVMWNRGIKKYSAVGG